MTTQPKVTGEMLSLIEAATVDYKGKPICDDGEARYGISCGDLRALLSLSRRVIEPGEEEIERCARALALISTGIRDRDLEEAARAVLSAISEG